MRIPIVNEEDEIIGHKERDSKGPEDLHRISILWLWNEKGEVLLAQRAFTKKYLPGLWGPSVAGTVEEDETYESNIIKEAEEEIGVKNLKPVLSQKLRRKGAFAQWFTATINSDYPLIKQDIEVEAIKWFSKEELFNAIEKNPEIFLQSMKDRAEYYFNNANQS